MTSYEALSPHDFEILVRDLLQEEWATRLESFSPGPDGGVDIRLMRDGISKTIQCKHHPNSALSALAPSLKKEAAKIAATNLGEYWLATSARATPSAKESTARIFEAKSLIPDRILAIADIENLLERHPRVRRSHVKLYLSSVGVLQTVLNNAIHVRQGYLKERLSSHVKYFVNTRAVASVHNLLETSGVCIVKGPPGVGKTAMAEAVAATYAQDGFEVYEVFSAREIEDVWVSGEKQIFLYDDFLGQTGLVEKLGINQDRALENIVKRLKKSKSHKLLMTTRTYILTAAQGVYSRLNSSDFVSSEIVVDVSEYTDFQKANILYNHVYYSNLSKAARLSIRKDQNYLKIVKHANYNPRLIESIVASGAQVDGAASSAGFAKFALNALDAPGELWRTAFDVELSRVQQLLALVAGVSNAATLKDEVIEASGALSLKEHGGWPLEKDLAVLEGLFLNVEISSAGRPSLRAKNPGIRDFLVQTLFEDQSLLAHYVEVAPVGVILTLLTLASGQGFSASKPWNNLSSNRKRFVVEAIQSVTPKILARFESAVERASAVTRISAMARSFPENINSGFTDSVITCLDRVIGSGVSQQQITDAYLAAEWLMSDKAAERILGRIRLAWDDAMDIDDIPAALELENSVGGDLVDELEAWLLEGASMALDDYSSQGFLSRSDMLDAVGGYLDHISGDTGDLPDRLESMREDAWEPDEDYESDRYRETIDVRFGSQDEIHGLFASLT